MLNAKGDDDDEDDQEDIELLEESEESFNITLSDVIGALYKNYPLQAVAVAISVFEKIINASLEGEPWEVRLAL